MKIQLITFPGCPNAKAARATLERVLARAGVADRIEEVDATALETAEELRGWGSPTVLVEGRDVGGQAEPTGPGCRLYRDDDGKVQGSPPEALLSAAIRRGVDLQ